MSAIYKLLRGRPMARQWPLKPFILVRIQTPEQKMYVAHLFGGSADEAETRAFEALYLYVLNLIG